MAFIRGKIESAKNIGKDPAKPLLVVVVNGTEYLSFEGKLMGMVGQEAGLVVQERQNSNGQTKKYLSLPKDQGSSSGGSAQGGKKYDNPDDRARAMATSYGKDIALYLVGYFKPETGEKAEEIFDRLYKKYVTMSYAFNLFGNPEMDKVPPATSAPAEQPKMKPEQRQEILNLASDLDVTPVRFARQALAKQITSLDELTMAEANFVIEAMKAAKTKPASNEEPL